jgi:hypothetical protein
MPPHWSITLTVAIPAWISPSTSIVPEAGVCLMALLTRLRTARPISAVSMSTGMPRTAEPASRIPLARATGSALASTSATMSSSPTSRGVSRSVPAWILDSSKRSSIMVASRSASMRSWEW